MHLVALRCIQKYLIKYRFLVWHYNRKCLCIIRKLVKLNMPICIYTALDISGYICSVDRKHLSSAIDTL